MSPLEIEELARLPKESAAALDARLTELRSKGAGILECIRYVRLNQGCSLVQAGDIVVNSRAWVDRKEAFLRHQQEMFEEFLDYNKDRFEAIHPTFTPDRTEVVVRMKSPDPAEELTPAPGTPASGTC